jgi:RNA polymerase sigma-70 factor, ECF subfamily
MPRQKVLFFRSKGEKEVLDEKSFIQESLKGDHRAFEKLVEQYRDRVFWTAYNLVLDHEDARDVSQQSFIKIWKSLALFDQNRSFAGWVCKITANCAIDFLRARKEMEPITDVAPERATIDRDLDIRKMFDRIAPLLSERQRVVLVLREIYGMEISEISEILSCTESTVRNLLSQAKDSFRRKAKELFPDYGV